MSNTDQHLNFIQKALQAIGSFLGLIKREATTVVSTANDIVNQLKAFDKTDAGQFIEKIAQTFVPVNLQSAFKLWLPIAFKSLNWATSEISKTDAQIFADALTYVLSLKGDYKAVQLTSLQALIASWLASNTGVTLPIQQALTIAPVAHDPRLVEISS